MRRRKKAARAASFRIWVGTRLPASVHRSGPEAADGVLRLRRGKSGTFDDGIQMALRAMLVSPDFLFRVEHDPAGAAPGTVIRVNDYELASRLSFFLWSSIPG